MNDGVVNLDLLSSLLTSGSSGDFETAVVELARAQAVLTWTTNHGNGKAAPDGPEGWLSPGQVAALLDVKESRVYQLARTGDLVSKRVGRYVRFSPAAVADFQNRRR